MLPIRSGGRSLFATAKIRVLRVEDSPVMRRAIMLTLAKYPSLEIAGAAPKSHPATSQDLHATVLHALGSP